jgi:hypothetical protein
MRELGSPRLCPWKGRVGDSWKREHLKRGILGLEILASALTGFDHVALNLIDQSSAHAGVVDGFVGPWRPVLKLQRCTEFFPLRGPFEVPRRQCLSFNSSR